MTGLRALVLAAGRGTRLRPFTDSLPKCLMPVGGRTLLDYWLMQLASAGVRHIVINTHHLREPVREYIAAVNRRGGQRMTESFEPQLLGSAGTISANRALAEGADDVILIYADNYSDVDLAAMLKFHWSHTAPVTMMLFRTTTPAECGIATVSEDGLVVAFAEKPRAPRGNLANAGVIVVTAEAYREIADSGASDLARDVLPRFVSRMRGWTHSGRHMDIGTPERYAQACHQALQANAGGGIGLTGLRPAVFLQRDGVLIDRRASTADAVPPRPLRGAAQALSVLRRSGHACVVLAADNVHPSFDEQMCEAFAAEGVVFDAVWRHPVASTPVGVLPDPVVETAIASAAADMRLDLARSWRVGTTETLTDNDPATSGELRLCAAAVSGNATNAAAVATCPDLGRAVRLLTENSSTALRQVSA